MKGIATKTVGIARIKTKEKLERLSECNSFKSHTNSI